MRSQHSADIERINEQDYNDLQLGMLKSFLLHAYQDQLKQTEMDKLFKHVQKLLETNNIVLNLDDGVAKLQNLIADASFDLSVAANNEREVMDKFNSNFKTWAETYQTTQWIASQDMRERAAQNPGITQTLKNGETPYHVWGDGLDFRMLFGTHMETPEKVATSGTHILTSVSLTQASGDESRIGPHSFLQYSLETVLQKKLGKVRLLIPVNFSGMHWGFADVTITENKITKAVLWDPAHKPNPESTALKNMQKAVDNLTQTKVKVTGQVASAKTRQKDGYMCFYHVAQQIFKRSNFNLNSDTEAKAIRDASAENHEDYCEKLEKAVVYKIGEQLSLTAPKESRIEEVKEQVKSDVDVINTNKSVVKEKKAAAIQKDKLDAEGPYIKFQDSTGVIKAFFDNNEKAFSEKKITAEVLDNLHKTLNPSNFKESDLDKRKGIKSFQVKYDKRLATLFSHNLKAGKDEQTAWEEAQAKVLTEVKRSFA